MTLARPDVTFPVCITWAVPVFLSWALPSVNASDRLVLTLRDPEQRGFSMAAFPVCPISSENPFQILNYILFYRPSSSTSRQGHACFGSQSKLELVFLLSLLRAGTVKTCISHG